MKRINSDDKRRLRVDVCNRHDGRCAYCYRHIGLKKGTIDHWLPQALGGTNARDNLRWACQPCNNQKADMHPDEWEQRMQKVNEKPESQRVTLLRLCAERMR